jgi:hypothetical protein
MQKVVTVVLAVLALVAVGYLLYSYTPASSTKPSMMMMTPTMSAQSMMMTPTMAAQSMMMPTVEHFADSAPAGQVSVDGSESIPYIEQPQQLAQSGSGEGPQMNQLPSECYPKDVLASADLLPRDANSLWAQVNPSGQGSLADQNFLTAGFHIGINTVGQTLRNANRQLRSEPLNPQVKVSPWLQTTIEPDINRRPLEIQGDL